MKETLNEQAQAKTKEKLRLKKLDIDEEVQ